MGEADWVFRFYDAADGSKPVEMFIYLILSEGERGALLARLQMIGVKGFTVGGEILENLGDDLYAVRVPNTKHNPRFFMCPISPKIFVLVHAYAKRTDDIPASEERIARKRVKDVLGNTKRYIR